MPLSRVGAHHLGVGFVHGGVVVGEICLVGLVVYLLLTGRHLLQVPDIVGVAQCHTVFRFGKLVEDEPAPCLGSGGIAEAHVHQVQVVIYVEAVHIVGIPVEQPLPFGFGRRIVLELVLEYEAHVEKAFAYDVVGVKDLHFGRRNLGEVIFGVVRIGRAVGHAGIRCAAAVVVGRRCVAGALVLVSSVVAGIIILFA